MESLEQSKYPVKFLQTLRGDTAHVILFSDGKKYVVKWNGSHIKRTKEVVNEFISCKLGILLSLPVVPFDVVYIPDEFIQNTPELYSKKFNFSSGYHYGCLFIENSKEFDEIFITPPSKSEITNVDALAFMMVFDQWVNNTDRTMSNLLLEPRSDGNYYVHMIDHGKCFPGGYNWSAQTLSLNQNHENNYQEIYQWAISLLSEEVFLSFVEKIISLPNESIYEIIQSIPNDWEVSHDEREALYNFLLVQKNNLSNIILKLIQKYYTNNFTKKEKEKKKSKKKEKKMKKKNKKKDKNN